MKRHSDPNLVRRPGKPVARRFPLQVTAGQLLLRRCLETDERDIHGPAGEPLHQGPQP